jgi:hypothetical protein
MAAADGDGGEKVVTVPGEDDADGDLTVVGGIGRVEGAAAVVESHFAADLPSKSARQSRRVHFPSRISSHISGSAVSRSQSGFTLCQRESADAFL